MVVSFGVKIKVKKKKERQVALSRKEGADQSMSLSGRGLEFERSGRTGLMVSF